MKETTQIDEFTKIDLGFWIILYLDEFVVSARGLNAMS
jgi:hypothetical protein